MVSPRYRPCSYLPFTDCRTVSGSPQRICQLEEAESLLAVLPVCGGLVALLLVQQGLLMAFFSLGNEVAGVGLATYVFFPIYPLDLSSLNCCRHPPYSVGTPAWQLNLLAIPTSPPSPGAPEEISAPPHPSPLLPHHRRYPPRTSRRTTLRSNSNRPRAAKATRLIFFITLQSLPLPHLSA